jgi:hypothetical protein
MLSLDAAQGKAGTTILRLTAFCARTPALQPEMRISPDPRDTVNVGWGSSGLIVFLAMIA